MTSVEAFVERTTKASGVPARVENLGTAEHIAAIMCARTPRRETTPPKRGRQNVVATTTLATTNTDRTPHVVG